MLRHLAGLLIGAVLAPALWAAVSWSAELLPRLSEGQVTFTTVSAGVLLGVAGAVGAGLVATRVSPMVAATSGLLLAATALWPVVAPQTTEPALGWLNSESFLYPSGPGLTVALPLGVLLFGSALTPMRWRALHDVPDRAERGRYRAAPPEDPMEEPDLEGRGAVGDTLPEPPAQPVPYDPPPGSGLAGDPEKTTTPFRRGEGGASWTPLDDEAGQNRFYRGDRP
ncbi:hypothetical protein [Nocardiopsis xinjiangensis]|uniref:hypothetical protein n=1 Tax=Nocardiopsis xinjiangensis TaxID=124285 RepID=UPI00034D2E0B|nr:hypothetical protein [Nocardiopsis xinjiangensis]